MKHERCPWCLGFEEYQKYHDLEWGMPCRDDQKLFEFLVLESAQAGLSWATILKRREGYRRAFANFNPALVAQFDEAEIKTLMSNKEIIRNRLKIESAINNARVFVKLQKEYGTFADFLWRYVNDKPITNKWKSMSEVPSKTELSDKLAKDFKKIGFRFLGSTILYSYLQAMGLVNDHLVSCYRHKEIK
ncbi:MAG: DNA-3-methyladenine glycosylase I [Bacteroidetes bacterium]|nr:DNA-3-methyladenine glycosylase I [Bacteroidota bacterium]